MAPRLLEPKEALLARLRSDFGQGARQVRFGAYHDTHVACEEAGTWRVRALEVEEARAEAFLATHGRLLPEDAASLSVPGRILIEAASLEELVQDLDRRWPL